MEYKDRFLFVNAYSFLTNHGLKVEAENIKASSEWYKSYRATLKRAKIIGLVIEKGLLEAFYDEVWPSGKTEKGRERTLFLEDLLRSFIEEGPNSDTAIEEEDDAENSLSGGGEFAYENDLQNYLLRNLHHIEKGLILYKTEQDNEAGREFRIPETSRRIDILAVDKDKTFVVIELKVSRGYDRVIGQTLYYQSEIKSFFNKEKVRAIIVAREITPELRKASQSLQDVELFEYQISFTLEKVK